MINRTNKTNRRIYKFEYIGISRTINSFPKLIVLTCGVRDDIKAPHKYSQREPGDVRLTDYNKRLTKC